MTTRPMTRRQFLAQSSVAGGLVLLGGAASASATGGSGARPRYRVAALDPPPGSRAVTPRAVNNQGEVVGFAYRRNGPPFACLYRQGVGEALAEPISEACDLNDRGQAVGFRLADGRESHAALWQPAAGKGKAETIDLGVGSARAINSGGQVVGTFRGGSLWTPARAGAAAGTLTRIRPPGADPVELWDVNDQGQVVGEVHERVTEVYPVRGFVWEKGRFTFLGSLSGPHTQPRAINDAGQVVGWSTYRAIPRGIAPLYLHHAFLWQGGKMHDLGTLREGRNSQALGLNSKGQVVGWSEVQDRDGPAGGSRVAFLSTNGTLYDLNALIAPDSGWLLREASAINDRGQIVGLGARDSKEGCAFLLTPT